MREVFAHDALVAMSGDADERAPGAAVTVALCGHWDHEPPCPLAPHHTAAVREGDVVRLRILFAADPGDEVEVRRRVGRALGGGRVRTPDGGVVEWRLLSEAPAVVRPEEEEHGRRLVAS